MFICKSETRSASVRMPFHAASVVPYSGPEEMNAKNSQFVIQADHKRLLESVAWAMCEKILEIVRIRIKQSPTLRALDNDESATTTNMWTSLSSLLKGCTY